jgi:XTP/dITP diphosphohydrolase
MRVCFATNNQNKLAEIRKYLGSEWQVISLDELGCSEELPETGDTLQHNAWQKANYIHQHYGISCFADDTGLEVEALNGEPGVYSARYAGPQRSNADNIAKLLSSLKNVQNRKACFRTVLCYYPEEGDMMLFEGEVCGEILEEEQGEGGFGYDPIFRPEGETRSFAQMSMPEKNSVSHRARAMQKLADYLKSRQNTQ